jgi:Uma2 family endonuclease
MATVASKLMTAEEFFDFANRPENRDRHFELENGEIVEMSRPGELHGVVCGNTVWLFGSYTRRRKRGRVCSNDMGLIVKRRPDTVRGPDISLYTDNKKYEKLNRKYPKSLPTLIVEVLSPNDRLGRIIKRIERFLALGVQVAWLIDPESRNVTIFRAGQAPYVLEENEEIADLRELPGFRCRVADLFEVNED